MIIKTSYNDITISIVMYKEDYELISRTLKPINSFKKIIIDNAGNLDLKQKIESNFKIDEYILNKKNYGFSAGYNQAVKLCKTKYSLILNPDCIISEKDTLSTNLNNFLIKKKYKNVIFFNINHLDNIDKLNINLSNLFKNNKIEYVFLCHALSGGIKYNLENPAKLITYNLNSTITTLKLSQKYNIKKLINISSSCIYPINCKQPLKVSYLMSDKLEKTNEAFAISKLTAMHMCQAYNKEYKTNFITVIPANYFGPFDKFDINKSHVITSLINKIHFAKKNKIKYVEIWGTGKPKRDFIYIDDLIEGIYFTMMNYNNRNLPINISTGEVISIKSLAYKLKKIIKYDGKFIFNISKPDGMSKKYLDGKILEKLGWKKKYNIDQGLNLTYKWYKKNIQI